ncbi:MAG: c-type cytochrome [Anaerolineae bacterium]
MDPIYRRIALTLVIMATPFILGLALTYEVIQVDVGSFMEGQPSVGNREGPRILPPHGAVPVTGLEVPADNSVPANPVAATGASVARGETLFAAHCAVCHGGEGRGDGPVVEYMDESASEVSDLREDRIVAAEDGLIYLTISKGFQGMPSLVENLTPRERWDVINFVRSLQGSS